MRQIAYVCSPYKANNRFKIAENVDKAIEISRKAYKQGLIPICVHTFLEQTTGLKEGKIGNRKELLKIGKEILQTCDVIIINLEGNISKGMKQEIKLAEELGITKIYYKKGEIQPWKM